MYRISKSGVVEVQSEPQNVIKAPFEALVDSLDWPEIVLEQASAADGRPASAAARLRALGYTGTISVVGPVVPDQWPLYVECGVDAIYVASTELEDRRRSSWSRVLTLRPALYARDASNRLNTPNDGKSGLSIWQQRAKRRAQALDLEAQALEQAS